jgi:hypothetical protein
VARHNTEILQMVDTILTRLSVYASMAAKPSADDAPSVTLSVVIPMFNEGRGIDRLFADLEESLALAACSYEIICVNDGSRDDTLASLIAHRERNSAINIVSFSRNFGKDIALTAGLIYSRGAAVLPFDADLQDPPNLIPAMLARWREGYDIVNAVRRSRGDGLLKRIGATLFYQAYNAVADTKIPPDVGDFRLMDRRVVNCAERISGEDAVHEGPLRLGGISSDRDSVRPPEPPVRRHVLEPSPALQLCRRWHHRLQHGAFAHRDLYRRRSFSISDPLHGVFDHPRGVGRQRYPGLCVTDGDNAPIRWNAVYGAWHARGIHRPNLPGGKAPAPIHHRPYDRVR